MLKCWSICGDGSKSLEDRTLQEDVKDHLLLYIHLSIDSNKKTKGFETYQKCFGCCYGQLPKSAVAFINLHGPSSFGVVQRLVNLFEAGFHWIPVCSLLSSTSKTRGQGAYDMVAGIGSQPPLLGRTVLYIQYMQRDRQVVSWYYSAPNDWKQRLSRILLCRML